jgi:hypothetical protein
VQLLALGGKYIRKKVKLLITVLWWYDNVANAALHRCHACVEYLEAEIQVV